MILSLEKFRISAAPEVPKQKKVRAKTKSTTTDIFEDPVLMDLVRLRVMQILDCKPCLREYANKLRAKGETKKRLRLLATWRKETVFSLREKAALNLAEAVTCNPVTEIPTCAIYAAGPFFTEEEMLLFVLEIVAITDWHYLKGFQNGNMTGRPPHE